MVCTIPDCDGGTVARGWCKSHYYAWKRNGDPTIRKRLPKGATIADALFVTLIAPAALMPAGLGLLVARKAHPESGETMGSQELAASFITPIEWRGNWSLGLFPLDSLYAIAATIHPAAIQVIFS
jgi:hypothetical protein